MPRSQQQTGHDQEARKGEQCGIVDAFVGPHEEGDHEHEGGQEQRIGQRLAPLVEKQARQHGDQAADERPGDCPFMVIQARNDAHAQPEYGETGDLREPARTQLCFRIEFGLGLG